MTEVVASINYAINAAWAEGSERGDKPSVKAAETKFSKVRISAKDNYVFLDTGESVFRFGVIGESSGKVAEMIISISESVRAEEREMAASLVENRLMLPYSPHPDAALAAAIRTMGTNGRTVADILRNRGRK